MIYLGVDPDLHNTGLALADHERVYAVRIVTVPGKLKGERAVVEMCKQVRFAIPQLLSEHYQERNGAEVAGGVVEGQQRYVGKGGTPDVLINLACVAGAAIAQLADHVGPEATHRPLPRQWKGDVPKAIHQARLCSRLGWSYEKRADYVVPHVLHAKAPVPFGVELLKDAAWKHVMDAIGLARWGSCQAQKKPW